MADAEQGIIVLVMDPEEGIPESHVVFHPLLELILERSPEPSFYREAPDRRFFPEAEIAGKAFLPDHGIPGLDHGKSQDGQDDHEQDIFKMLHHDMDLQI
jgi:hypothetical protein